MEQHRGVGIAKGELALEFMNNTLVTLETFSRAASKMEDLQSKGTYSKALGTSGSI